jgi:hypothetical protein
MKNKHDTYGDVVKLVKAVERDNIPNDLKRKRIQFIHALTASKAWRKDLGASAADKAYTYTGKAYKRYLKSGSK